MGTAKCVSTLPWFWEATLLAQGPFKNINFNLSKKWSWVQPKAHDLFFFTRSPGPPTFPQIRKLKYLLPLPSARKPEPEFMVMYLKGSETVGETFGRLEKSWHVLGSPCEAFCSCHFLLFFFLSIYSHLTMKYLGIAIYRFCGWEPYLAFLWISCSAYHSSWQNHGTIKALVWKALFLSKMPHIS